MEKILFFLPLFVFPLLTTGTILYYPEVTPYGYWGRFYECPPNYFATGFVLKVHRPHACKAGDLTGLLTDDMAVVGVKLVCGYRDNHYKQVQTGDFGWLGFDEIDYWTLETSLCPSERVFANAFQLRAESPQGSEDDTSVNNLELVCANSFTGAEGLLTGNGRDWGSWRGFMYCPPSERICGIQLKIEVNQGDGDDTALNNLNIKCCPLWGKEGKEGASNDTVTVTSKGWGA